MAHHRTLRILSLVTAMSFAPLAAAFAQAPPPPPPPKQEGSAELAYVGTTGNSKERTLSAVATTKPSTAPASRTCQIQ